MNFYGKSKVSKENETALQAVKRAKAVDKLKKSILKIKIKMYIHLFFFK